MSHFALLDKLQWISEDNMDIMETNAVWNVEIVNTQYTFVSSKTLDIVKVSTTPNKTAGA